MSAKVQMSGSKNNKSGQQRPDSNSEGSEIESENHLSQDEGGAGGSGGNGNNPQETDLFSFLSAMHLSGGLGGQMHPAAAQVLASRKRKLLDQSGGAHLGSGSGSGKLFGSMRPPGHRRNSDEEVPLHTPQCSQSGFADEEDRRHHQGDIESDDNDVQHHHHHQQHQHHHHHHHQASSSYKSRQGTLTPDQQQQIGDIDENLAADFDGSLSGLGVDMNSSTYSMSEALMALPNLSIGTGQMFKQEVASPPTHHRLVNISHTSTPSRLVQCSLKEEPISNLTATTSRSHKGNHSPSLDALDLSSDEAARFPESDSEEAILGPKAFAGSQEGSRNGTPTAGFYQSGSNHSQPLSFSGANLSSSHPSLSTIGKNENDASCSNLIGSNDNSNKSHKIILQNQSSSSSLVSRKDSQELVTVDEAGNAAATGSKFQYVLNASTSIATKVSEPSITYINQGQSYELSLNKIGDATTFRKRLLKCQLRVCFHERRLQYMEAEQIAEWSSKHPGERILDIDLPLSYGVIDPVRDPCGLNMITFKWDPTRDTGVYIKVNCISTEFTPKKHGGEKGVPFRLQVESFDPDDNRLHAAGCVIRVFKLKGADRKHKQDRDKIQKRTPAEQEKFARPYDKTILTDLPAENVYVPPTSRSDSPELVLINTATADSVLKTSHSRHSSREETSPAMYYSGGGLQQQYSVIKDAQPLTGLPIMTSPCMATTSNAVTPNMLSATASVETVTQWLSRNRYSSLLGNFRNYNGRDLLRLSREDVISMCGLSDGIRLYNDLHMAPVAPRTTFYVALKDSNKYDALFLEELTVAELVKRFSQCVGLNADLFGGIFKRVSQGFLVRVTNEVVQYTDPESVFYFTLRHCEDGSSDKCDIILEDAIHVLHDVLKNNPTALEVNNVS